MFYIKDLITKDVRDKINNELSEFLLNMNNIKYTNELQIKNKSTYDQIKLRTIKSEFFKNFVGKVYRDDFNSYVSLNSNLNNLVYNIYTYLNNFIYDIPYESDYYLHSVYIDDDLDKYTLRINDNKLIIIYNENKRITNNVIPSLQYVTLSTINNDLSGVIELYSMLKNIKEYKYFLPVYSEFKNSVLKTFENTDNHEKYYNFFEQKESEYKTLLSSYFVKCIKVSVDFSLDTITYEKPVILKNKDIPDDTNPFDIFEYNGNVYMYYTSYEEPDTGLSLSFNYLDSTGNITTEDVSVINDPNGISTNIESELNSLKSMYINSYIRDSKIFIFNNSMSYDRILDLKLYVTEFENSNISFDSILDFEKELLIKEQRIIKLNG